MAAAEHAGHLVPQADFGVVERAHAVVEAAAGAGPADIGACHAPPNRYHGLSDVDLDELAALTGTTIEAVQAALTADLVARARE